MQGQQPYRLAEVVAAFENVASVLHPDVKMLQNVSTNYILLLNLPNEVGALLATLSLVMTSSKGKVANGGKWPKWLVFIAFRPTSQVAVALLTLPAAGPLEVICDVLQLEKITSQNWLPRQDWMKS